MNNQEIICSITCDDANTEIDLFFVNNKFIVCYSDSIDTFEVLCFDDVNQALSEIMQYLKDSF